MKVTLMNAISLDGFICSLEGDSDWVADDDAFEAEITNHECIIVGRTTFEQYEGEIYPIANVVNVVLVGNTEDFTDEQSETLMFMSGEPSIIADKLAEQGFTSALLVGGSETNARFATAGLIDEVILDVHPLLIGTGKRLLGDYPEQLTLENVQTTQHDGFTQIRARVTKTA
jgi:dihydrofolate reductase